MVEITTSTETTAIQALDVLVLVRTNSDGSKSLMQFDGTKLALIDTSGNLLLSNGATLGPDGTSGLVLTATTIRVANDFPITDPGVRGQLWNNGNLMGISAGS